MNLKGKAIVNEWRNIYLYFLSRILKSGSSDPRAPSRYQLSNHISQKATND